MNWPGKSTDSSGIPETDWTEELARLQYLQALFPEWTDGDRFLLQQLKASIEAVLQDEGSVDPDYSQFAHLADRLRQELPGGPPRSHAFLTLDFKDRTWDPLFARQEIIRRLKEQAGVDEAFLVIRGLRKALFPAARYRTRNRECAHAEATAFIDELVRRWSTPSSCVHLLYL